MKLALCIDGPTFPNNAEFAEDDPLTCNKVPAAPAVTAVGALTEIVAPVSRRAKTALYAAEALTLTAKKYGTPTTNAEPKGLARTMSVPPKVGVITPALEHLIANPVSPLFDVISKTLAAASDTESATKIRASVCEFHVVVG